MPLSQGMTHILLTFVFNNINGVDGVARDNINKLLANVGLDDASDVYEIPTGELAVVKLRQLFTTDAAKLLLKAVEDNEGQLAKISKFLRRLQSGSCSRFLIDHDPNNIEHLRHFTEGSAAVHSFSDQFTPYTFDAKLTDKLKLTNAASYRLAVTHIRANLPQIAYLLDPLPQDTHSKIGKMKDDNLHQFWTLLITASNLDKTFKLGSVDISGHALCIKAKEYFLNDADSIIEIQHLTTEFLNLKFTTGVADIIEEMSGLVTSLQELGKDTTNIEFYTKLSTLLSNNLGYLQTFCLTFRATHHIPNEHNTLNEFLSLLTNDQAAMAIRKGSTNQNRTANNNNNKNNNNNNNNNNNSTVDANSVDVKEARKITKKARKADDKKKLEAALNSLSLQYNISVPTPPSQACIRVVEKIRITWSDTTIGLRSDLNKLWNAHLDQKGDINYPSFCAQLLKEHKAPPPPPTSQRNPNVHQANALETDLALYVPPTANIRRCEEDDTVRSDGRAQTSNIEVDEAAAQIFSPDRVDAEISK
jgi:hypothetical protein